MSLKYDSFGNIIERSGDLELPFGFAGGIWDEDTKLIRFGVRDYDPETGRWTSKEPLGFAGSRNWYVYSYNNPVNWYDLTGFKPGDPFDTPEKAAIDALNYIYGESMLLGREMGGIIYQGDDGCFYASEPVMGEPDGIYDMPNTWGFAWYHTHPLLEGTASLHFSEDKDNGDLGYSNEHLGDAYMKNYVGDILKYSVIKGEVKEILDSEGNLNPDDDFYRYDVDEKGNYMDYDEFPAMHIGR